MPQLLIQLLVTVLAAYMLISVVTYRSVPKFRYYFLLACAIFMYAFGYLMELSAETLDGAYMAQRVQYIGIVTYAPLLYLFVCEYNGRLAHSPVFIAALFAYPAVVLVTMNLYPEFRGYFHELTFTEEPSPRLLIERGFLFHLHIIYSYILIVMTTLEILFKYPRRNKEEKQKRLMFLAASVAPTVAIIIFAVDPKNIYMQFGSMSLVVSITILGYYILRYCPQDWLQYARDYMITQLQDGYILLDTEGCYLDANPAAIKFFPFLKKVGKGIPISIIPGLEKVMTADKAPYETKLTAQDGGYALRISSSPICFNSVPVCTSVLIYDMTETRRLMDKMEELASYDGLTGLLNRETFFYLSRRDFDLHQRTSQPACIAMLDIDYFKSVNDTYGHQCGDDVLQQIAKAVTARLRHTDIPGRYGGEEFCVFLPATDMGGAMVIAGHIREAIEEMTFTCYDGSFQVTVSLGLAALDRRRHKCLEDMIAEADAALYDAKNTGRNKVVAFHTTPAVAEY